MVTPRHDTGWTHDVIADIGAALGHSAEETGALLGSLGAERRFGAAVGDDDLSHVPVFRAN